MTRLGILILIASLGLSVAACRREAPSAAVAAAAATAAHRDGAGARSGLDRSAGRGADAANERSPRSRPGLRARGRGCLDEVPDQNPRRQLTSIRRVALRRPDHLVGDAAGDAVNRSFFYDDQVFSALDKEQNVWAERHGAPHGGRGARQVFEQTGTVAPARRFSLHRPYDRLMAYVQRGVYLGIHEAAGVPAITCPSSRLPSTGRSGSTPVPSRCLESWSLPTRPKTKCRSTR